MITLEKLLTELNAGSLNEIIAGGGGKCTKNTKRTKGTKVKKEKKSKKDKCLPTPKTCPPGNSGCQ